MAQLQGDALSLELAEVESIALYKQFKIRRSKSIFSDALESWSEDPRRVELVVRGAVRALSNLDDDHAVEHLAERLFSLQNRPAEPREGLFGIRNLHLDSRQFDGHYSGSEGGEICMVGSYDGVSSHSNPRRS